MCGLRIFIQIHTCQYGILRLKIYVNMTAFVLSLLRVQFKWSFDFLERFLTTLNDDADYVW